LAGTWPAEHAHEFPVEVETDESSGHIVKFPEVVQLVPFPSMSTATLTLVPEKLPVTWKVFASALCTPIRKMAAAIKTPVNAILKRIIRILLIDRFRCA